MVSKSKIYTCLDANFTWKTKLIEEELIDDKEKEESEKSLSFLSDGMHTKLTNA